MSRASAASALARAERDTDLGLARDRQLSDASRVNPTCVDPAQNSQSAMLIQPILPWPWVPDLPSRYALARPGHAAARPGRARCPGSSLALRARSSGTRGGLHRPKCDLHHIGADPIRLSFGSCRAIDDGGRSPITALWAFPPSTWPRGSGWRGLFRLRAIAERPGRGRHTLSNAKKERAGQRPARECRESGPPGTSRAGSGRPAPFSSR